MKIAIAGASGFIGSALCHHLTKSHEIVAISREPKNSNRRHPLLSGSAGMNLRKRHTVSCPH